MPFSMSIVCSCPCIFSSYLYESRWYQNGQERDKLLRFFLHRKSLLFSASFIILPMSDDGIFLPLWFSQKIAPLRKGKQEQTKITRGFLTISNIFGFKVFKTAKWLGLNSWNSLVSLLDWWLLITELFWAAQKNCCPVSENGLYFWRGMWKIGFNSKRRAKQLLLPTANRTIERKIFFFGGKKTAICWRQCLVGCPK